MRDSFARIVVALAVLRGNNVVDIPVAIVDVDKS